MASNSGTRKGRPARIDAGKVNVLCEAIQHGAYVETAVLLAGIPKATLYAWLKLAAEDDKKGKTDTEYQRVSNQVKTALAGVELEYIKTVEKASATTWQAAAWMLERRFGERWKLEKNGPMNKAA